MKTWKYISNFSKKPDIKVGDLIHFNSLNDYEIVLSIIDYKKPIEYYSNRICCTIKVYDLIITDKQRKILLRQLNNDGIYDFTSSHSLLKEYYEHYKGGLT